MDKLTKLTLAFILLSFNLALALDGKSYSLLIDYDYGELINGSVELISGAGPDRLNQPDVGYKAELMSFNSNILYSFKFVLDPNPIAHIVYKPINKTHILLIVPYFSNGKLINIYDPDGILKLTIDLSHLSQCNENNICDNKETPEICPLECEVKIKATDFIAPIVTLSAIVGLIIIIIFLYKRRYG